MQNLFENPMKQFVQGSNIVSANDAEGAINSHFAPADRIELNKSKRLNFNTHKTIDLHALNADKMNSSANNYEGKESI